MPVLSRRTQRGFRLWRLSALTRRCDIAHYGIVNSRPAKCCVWPDLVPAQAFVRAGGTAGVMLNWGTGNERVRRCGSGAAVFPRFTFDIAVLSWRLPLFMSILAFLLSRFASVHVQRCGSEGNLRSVRARGCGSGGNVRSVHIRRCGSGGRLPSFRAQSRVSVVALCLGSRLLFAALRQTGRLAISCVSIPQVEIAFVRSRSVGVVIGLCRFTSGLGVSLWRSRRVIGDTENGERGYGVGGAVLVRLCAVALALRRFPWGVRWGLRAPKPAPKSLRLSGLSSGAGRVRKCVQCGTLPWCVYARRHPGTRKDLTDSENVAAALRLAGRVVLY